MSSDRADDWFEALYASVGDDWERVPWAQLAPRPGLVRWLDRHPPRPGTRALVVACGLGDDAEELARRGCAVEAFDLSPTAIAAARRRFPESAVGYRVADLFALPEEWRRRFDVVVEVQTIQSLAPEFHRAAIDVIAELTAPDGHVLVRAAVRGEDEPAESRPWPLKDSELRWFEAAGLREVSRCADDGVVEIDYHRRRGPGCTLEPWLMPRRCAERRRSPDAPAGRRRDRAGGAADPPGLRQHRSGRGTPPRTGGRGRHQCVAALVLRQDITMPAISRVLVHSG